MKVFPSLYEDNMGYQKDAVCQFVIEVCRNYPFIIKAVLFGSRGRGDWQDRSDYDFAFYTKDIDRAQWIEFVTQ